MRLVLDARVASTRQQAVAQQMATPADPAVDGHVYRVVAGTAQRQAVVRIVLRQHVLR